MSRVYVGNLEPRVSERDLEDDFRAYGVIKSIWVARRPPGYAFIDFEDHRDANDAIRGMDGKHGWRVELSRKGTGGGRSSGSGGRDRYGGSSDLNCYECGEPGHFARECRLRIGPGGLGSGRRKSRSPSPRYRRSPSYGRRSRSPRYSSPTRRSLSTRRRSLSPRPRSLSPRPRSLSPRPRSLSPRPRSLSPRRGRSYSRSPSYPNGNGADNEDRRSRSRS